jgi:hypothetical protein
MLFSTCLFLTGLYIAGVVAIQSDEWRVRISTSGSIRVGHVAHHYMRMVAHACFDEVAYWYFWQMKVY